MESRFDVHRGNIVRQQHNLIGMEFVAELVRQVIVTDQTRLNQPHNKGAGATEWVKDMDALITKFAAKVFA